MRGWIFRVGWIVFEGDTAVEPGRRCRGGHRVAVGYIRGIQRSDQVQGIIIYDPDSPIAVYQVAVTHGVAAPQDGSSLPEQAFPERAPRRRTVSESEARRPIVPIGLRPPRNACLGNLGRSRAEQAGGNIGGLVAHSE